MKLRSSLVGLGLVWALLGCAPVNTETLPVATTSPHTFTPQPTRTLTPSYTPTPKPAATATPIPSPTASLTPKASPTIAGLLNRVPIARPFELAWSPDGQRLAVTTARGLYLFDADTLAQRWFSPTDPGLQQVAFRQDSLKLTTSDASGAIQVWNVLTGQLALQATAVFLDPANELVFRPDGRVLASASFNKGTYIWDSATGEITQTLPDEYGFTKVAFAPDGEPIALSDVLGNISLWGIASYTPLQTFQGHTEWLFDLAFDPNGRLLASGSMDGTVRLWDTTTGAPLHVLIWNSEPRKYASSQMNVVFSPDGQRLAAGSDDGMIRVWEVATGELHQTISAHTKTVVSVAFSPDGKQLASIGDDDVLKLWMIEP